MGAILCWRQYVNNGMGGLQLALPLLQHKPRGSGCVAFGFILAAL